MSRPTICYAALGLALVAFGFSLAAFSIALVCLMGVTNG